jgi:hypothetical protein
MSFSVPLAYYEDILGILARPLPLCSPSSPSREQISIASKELAKIELSTTN